jgi:hypothetical protein
MGLEGGASEFPKSYVGLTLRPSQEAAFGILGSRIRFGARARGVGGLTAWRSSASGVPLRA